MIRPFIAAACLAGGALLGSAAVAKPREVRIDLSVTAAGTCQARIADQLVAVTAEELDAKLPALLPDRKTAIRLAESGVPYRCIGPLIASLQRLNYDSVTFATEPLPLGPEITSPPSADQ